MTTFFASLLFAASLGHHFANSPLRRHLSHKKHNRREMLRWPCALCRYRQSQLCHYDRSRWHVWPASMARSIQFMVIERVCRWRRKVSTAKWRYKWRFVVLERANDLLTCIIWAANHPYRYAHSLFLLAAHRRFIYAQQLFHVVGINHGSVVAWSAQRKPQNASRVVCVVDVVARLPLGWTRVVAVICSCHNWLSSSPARFAQMKKLLVLSTLDSGNLLEIDTESWK